MRPDNHPQDTAHGATGKETDGEKLEADGLQTSPGDVNAATANQTDAEKLEADDLEQNDGTEDA